jgi:hypothetical protein
LISKSKSVIFENHFWACNFDLWKQLRMYIIKTIYVLSRGTLIALPCLSDNIIELPCLSDNIIELPCLSDNIIELPCLSDSIIALPILLCYQTDMAILLCHQTDMAILLSRGFDSSYFLFVSKIKSKNIRYNVPVYVNKHLFSSLN